MEPPSLGRNRIGGAVRCEAGAGEIPKQSWGTESPLRRTTRAEMGPELEEHPKLKPPPEFPSGEVEDEIKSGAVFGGHGLYTRTDPCRG